MAANNLVLYEKPRLHRPCLIMGFEGWPDAGKISSGTVGYLREQLSAVKLADIKPDDFYLFQVPGVETRRPTVVIKDGLMKSLSIPSTVFWYSKRSGVRQDLILGVGLEPELAWNKYIDLLLMLCRRFDVAEIITIGGIYDAIPHTVAPLITATINTPGAALRIKGQDFELIDHKGPASIHTLLQAMAGKKNLQVTGLWGHSANYIQIPNPRICYAILQKLDRMLELSLDLEEAKKSASRLDEQINSIISQKPELREYIQRLEDEYRKGRRSSEPLAETDIIKEVEDFLKGHKSGN
jgi:proteasome assembly chaperone (PAC2) family protein